MNGATAPERREANMAGGRRKNLCFVLRRLNIAIGISRSNYRVHSIIPFIVFVLFPFLVSDCLRERRPKKGCSDMLPRFRAPTKSEIKFKVTLAIRLNCIQLPSDQLSG